MPTLRSIGASSLALVLLAAACGVPGPQAATPGQADGRASSGPKRIAAVVAGDPPFLYQTLNPAGARGGDALEELLHAGLTQHTDDASLRPQLAEHVPTLDNGLWKVVADGRMETTWTIRSGGQWHDGAPLSADDLLFTMPVMQDRDLPDFGNVAYESIVGMDASDPRTVRVRWKTTFIGADSLFTTELAMPLPKHLLEATYLSDKPGFLHAPTGRRISSARALSSCANG